MTNCTITLDVTGFGYTYLLQLDAMLGDFLEDGDNAAAADALHDWIGENARNFADDARANGDDLAAGLFSDWAADLEEEPANEEPETITRTALSGHEYTAANIDLAEAVAERNGCPVSLTADDDARELRATGTAAAIEDYFAFCREAAANDATDDAEDFGGSRYLAQIIADWRGRPENAELDNLLEQNAIDTNNAPENLYRAGVFAGLVTALRTQISWASDDHNEIEAAIYKAYGVAW